MSFLILGIAIFISIHLVSGFVAFRANIVNRLGEDRYKGLFALTALAGLVLIVYGKSVSAYQAVWNPPVWSRYIVIAIMMLAFYLFAVSEMKSNLKRFTRHPMLWGVALWSGAHLFANGDLASIVLFGAFLLFSLFAMVLANRRGALKQKTTYPVSKDVATIIAGFIAYGIFILIIHPYVIGVTIVGLG